MKRYRNLKAHFIERSAPAIAELERLAQSKNAYDLKKHEQFSKMYELAKKIAEYADAVTDLLYQTEAIASLYFDADRRKHMQELTDDMREIHAHLKGGNFSNEVKDKFMELARLHASNLKEEKLL